MCVVVGVAQLVGQGIQEEVAPLSVHVTCQAHKDVQGGLVHGVALWPRLVQVDSLQKTRQISTKLKRLGRRT